MQLTGIHHLTAITAKASENKHFYTQTLGLRLVKKTVNQDDVSAYHLFYADGLASPGSDITFFDWPVDRERRGNNAITRTAFRVAGADALEWWRKRFAQSNVAHGDIHLRDDRATLEFEDFEGQRLALIDDGGAGEAHAWARSPAPPERQIRGLGPITLTVPDLAPTHALLTQVMAMRPARDYADAEGRAAHVYEMGEGGAGAELHVIVDPHLPRARAGAGGVHHVAFRTPDNAQYEEWAARLNAMRIANSGPVDRFYFRSLYFREPNGVLFAIATDGPGFAADEPLEKLGERLALPPFLEGQRAHIEAGLRPL